MSASGEGEDSMANINVGRKSGFIVRGGAKRRETIWFGGTSFRQTLAAPTSSALVQVLSVGALSLRPFTVIRTRGILNVKSDQKAADEAYGASYGHAIVSDEASALGLTAVPDPTSDSDSDLWFVYEFILGEFVFGSGVAFEANAGVERVVDFKAMRKVEDGQDVVVVVEGAGAAIAGGSIISGFTRILVKLH